VVEKRLEEDASLSTSTINWQYDSMYRLTQEARTAPTGTTFTDSYVYDLVGNRLSKSSTGGSSSASTAYTYNANDQLLTEAGPDYSIAYQYDQNGSQTLKQRTGTDAATYSFAYNLENRLASATISRTENGTAVSLSTAYLYNQSGIRVRADATRVIGGSSSTSTVLYLNDPNNHTGYSQVLEELSDNGSTVSVARSYTIGDDVLAQATGPTTQHLAYDGHGSTRLLTGSSGSITSRFSFDAYGRTLNSEPETLNPSATSLLYTGEQFDSDLGQYYLRARYYDPSNGRFNRLDPFAGNNFEPKSLQKYSYAHNDPINAIDPSGAYTLLEKLIVIGSISTLATLVAGALISGAVVTL
jgi:RHS repeat-associated protein